jgi:opacity protein-like surface antigen
MSRFALLLVGLLIAIAALWAGSAYAQPGDEQQDKWRWEISPRIWPYNLSGDVRVRDLTIPVEADWDEISDTLHWGISLLAKTTKPSKPIGYILSIDFANFDGSTTLPSLAVLDSETDFLILSAGVVFRPKSDAQLMAEYQETGKIPIMYEYEGGVRFIGFDSDITVTPPPPGLVVQGGLDNSWAEPYLGGSVKVPISPKFGAWVRANVGGFGVGDSDFTYEANLAVQYKMSKKTALNLGYRWLGFDTIDNGNGADCKFSGPFLGSTWSF